VRLSPQDAETLSMVDRFRANETGHQPLMMARSYDCNGYWRRVAGLELVS